MAACVAACVAAAGVALALAGCTGSDARDAASTPGPPTSPAPTATDGDAPADEPATGALDELGRFDEVNRAVIAADAAAGGRAFLDALAAAGFDRSAMQVTSDTTTLGEPADSIQFSVRIGDRCLIGQYGPASDGYRSAERPGLGSGGCLVGATVDTGG
ncbi:hypothetical protein GLX25_15110 [Agromyces luteolus]|uniref:DUF6993 domain-containing protein n=1 Tax=Agromyces luteolus TaxID=88373 RepID=A0A7C9I1K3_9MICO|nr:hypothetical protein [Agromyces luteolus]